MDDPGVPTQNMGRSRGMVLIQQLLRICDVCDEIRGSLDRMRSEIIGRRYH